MRGQHLVDRAEGPATEFTGDGVSARRVGIHHADQPHLPGLLQLVVHAGMIAPEGSHPDDCDINGKVVAQKRGSGR
jgi:hypothetical protein